MVGPTDLRPVRESRQERDRSFFIAQHGCRRKELEEEMRSNMSTQPYLGTDVKEDNQGRAAAVPCVTTSVRFAVLIVLFLLIG
jgi:hypothetical protein